MGVGAWGHSREYARSLWKDSGTIRGNLAKLTTVCCHERESTHFHPSLGQYLSLWSGWDSTELWRLARQAYWERKRWGFLRQRVLEDRGTLSLGWEGAKGCPRGWEPGTDERSPEVMRNVKSKFIVLHRTRDGWFWAEENIVFPDVESGADWNDEHTLELGKVWGSHCWRWEVGVVRRGWVFKCNLEKRVFFKSIMGWLRRREKVDFKACAQVSVTSLEG